MTPDTPTQAAALPELPQPTIEAHPAELWGQNVLYDLFTADQMRAYATLALQEAHAELDALRADAERWRFVMDRAQWTVTMTPGFGAEATIRAFDTSADLPAYDESPHQLETLIDRAINHARKEGAQHD